MQIKRVCQDQLSKAIRKIGNFLKKLVLKTLNPCYVFLKEYIALSAFSYIAAKRHQSLQIKNIKNGAMPPKLSTDYLKKLNILIKILQSFLCKYKLNYILQIYFCESRKTAAF